MKLNLRLFILKSTYCVDFTRDSLLSLTKSPCLSLIKLNSESKLIIELRLLPKVWLFLFMNSVKFATY